MLRALLVLALLAGCSSQPSKQLIVQCKLEAAQDADTADLLNATTAYYAEVQACMLDKGYELQLDRPGCPKRQPGPGVVPLGDPVDFDDPVDHPACYVRASN
jgi:hypothetical protein